MSSEKVFIAVDLGAGSGRVIAAKTDFSKLELEEVHRFDNPGTDLPDGSYWNMIGLYREILEGLRIADASVIPRIISGNTNGPAMMIGMRAAEFILNDHANKE